MCTTSSYAAVSLLATVIWLLAVAAGADDSYLPWDEYCSACAVFEFLTPPPKLAYPSVTQFYSGYDDDICYDAYRNLTAHLDSPLFAAAGPGGLIPEDSVLSGFVDGERSCAPDAMKWCAQFSNLSAGAAVEGLIKQGVGRVMTEYLCASVRGAYGFRAHSHNDFPPGVSYECFPMDERVVCQQPARVPFPNCKCANDPTYEALVVQPDVSKELGSKPNTSLYCFGLAYVVPAAKGGAISNGGTTLVQHPGHGQQAGASFGKLSKVEIWADDSKRRYVRRVRLTKAGMRPVWSHTSWGAPGENTLKVTPLNWDLGEAIGGQICLEVHHDIGDDEPLSELCLGGACHVALFNEKKDACPTYNVALPPLPSPPTAPPYP